MAQLNISKSRLHQKAFELKELGTKSRPKSYKSLNKPKEQSVPFPKKLRKHQALTNIDVESIYKLLQLELEDKRQIVRDLKKKSDLQQENLVKREQEYRGVVFSQESKLDGGFSIKDPKLPDTARQKLEYIYKSHEKIIKRISDVQEKTLKLLQNQETEMVADLDTKLTEKWEELRNEKNSNSSLNEKNKREVELIKELDKYIEMVEGVDKSNKVCTQQNYLMKIKQKNSQEDLKIIRRQLDNAKAINKRLKERLKELRNGRLTPQPYLHDRSSSKIFEADKDSGEQYLDVVNKLKKMIEVENNNMRAARTALARELEERKELAKFVKLCVEDVKSKIIAKKSEQRMQISDKEFESLETTIEVLLSKERVLTLLYDKAFPPRLPKNELFSSYSLRSLQPSPLPTNKS